VNEKLDLSEITTSYNDEYQCIGDKAAIPRIHEGNAAHQG
jgi:hypothetical protein